MARILAIVPARGGSKGIPRKNLAPVAGRPLIAWTIEAARAARGIDRLVVSTDDPEIASAARAWGAETAMRPAELAADDTPTLPVLRHALAALGETPDAVLTLQPTSPLRRAGHIEGALDAFLADPAADSLVSVVAVPHVFHPRSVMKPDVEGYLVPYLDSAQPYRRQDKEPVFARNGAAIYITRTPRLAEYVFGGKLIGFPMDSESSLDVDTPEELALAGEILRRRGA
ncbi:MAG: acylneuraminate cytidylyltransferase family protein [Tagaea sp.]|nr:acylneuraminate cytidylyltransferase family protein [Tagaea sp.]